MKSRPSRLNTATSHAVGGRDDGPVAARRRSREIGRLDDRMLAVQERVDFAPPVDVVAHRHTVDTGRQEFAVDLGRNARTAGDVLRVGDHEVEPRFHAQSRQRALHDGLARFSHDVADEQDVHESISGAGDQVRVSGRVR